MRRFFERYGPKYIFLTILFLTAALIWSAVFRADKGRLTVAFLDVGQGDAIFIESGGIQILIDGGPNKSVISELSNVMPFYDRSIDALILSHPHKDHVGGLVEVLKRYDVDFVFDSGDTSSIAEFAEFKKLIRQKNIEEIFARRGMRINLGGGTYFDVLLPDEFEKSTDPHKNMVVGRLTHGENCFLMMGDAERSLEFKILGDDIACEVLKVGHHGSKTSTSEAFLSAVNPEIVVIQLGAANRYGHPYQAILEGLLATGAKVFRTDVDGSIIMESDGKHVYEK